MSWWSSLFGGKTRPKREASANPNLSENDDDLYPVAVARVMDSGNCSVSFVQSSFRIGFLRASKLIDAMERDGIISPLDASGSRLILSDQERENIDRSASTDGNRPDAEDPFDREFYFVPYPRISTPHSDLLLSGTRCYMSDPIFSELATRHGRWVPSNKSGQVSDFFTHTDIGQLDFAINDYIDFLVEVRAATESDLPEHVKAEMIKSIGQLTGSDGHSYAAFIEAHGGMTRFIAKVI
ncbi:hypothetical protein NJH24_18280 [Pseudomonas asiatica]|uniref:DNA translocase FtsK n=1 Tax=Pseudomonas asiatica TaxID=2219225 RepID=UPI00209ABA52|nr:DNA translocase FtsK [Pseudomonas asiatica]MCO7536724.1 hypothetical protein [Pseudomonas asiatica]MCO7550461.1 hypothetical protein [Pseudomonas asiatica]MCO7560038.1 hypothetical protein [Pseudomonas asiatica]